MSNPDYNQDQLDKAQEALSGLYNFQAERQSNPDNLDDAAFQYDMRLIHNAIIDTTFQVNAAKTALEEGTNPVDLSSYVTVERILDAGFAKEKRNLTQASAIDTITDVRNEITDVGRQIGQLITEDAEANKEQIQSLREDKSTLEEKQRILLAKYSEVKKIRPNTYDFYSKNYKPETRPNFKQEVQDLTATLRSRDTGLSYEDAREQALAKLTDTYDDPIMLDPSGQTSLAQQSKVALSSINKDIDYRTGTVYDKELGARREATNAELAMGALLPQVLYTRGDRQRQQELEEKAELRRESEQIGDKGGRTIPAEIGKVGLGIAKQMGKDALTDEKPLSEDVIIESPTMTVIRDISVLPNIGTGAALNATMYAVDKYGNPTDPEDFNYRLGEYFVETASMFGLPDYPNPFGIIVENEEDKPWLQATSKTNAVMSSVAKFPSFYEAYESSPFVDYIDENGAYGDHFGSAYVGSLLSWNMFGMSLLADMLMPMTPSGYIKPVAAVTKSGVKAATNASSKFKAYLKTNPYVNSKNIDSTLDFLATTDDYGNIISSMYEPAIKLSAGRIYKNEVQTVVNDALKVYGEVKPAAIAGHTIPTVQKNAAREVSNELASLGRKMIYGESHGTTGWAQEVGGNYEAWKIATRSHDNALNPLIPVLDNIIEDVRLIRSGGTIPSPKLYAAAFRDNLYEAARNAGKTGYKVDKSYGVNKIYREAAADAQVTEFAMRKTLEDAAMEALTNRLPIDQRIVGNRIIHNSSFTAKNLDGVSKIVTDLSGHTVKEGKYLLTTSSPNQLEIFISGVGAESIRQSPPLKALLLKIKNKTPLTQKEFRIYEEGVLGGAWQKQLSGEGVRKPVQISSGAYQAAIELRSNSVFRAKHTEMARQYATSKAKETVGKSAAGKTASKIKKQIGIYFKDSDAPASELLNSRLGLSWWKFTSDEFGRAPVAIRELFDNMNSLSSSEFDLMLTEIKQTEQKLKFLVRDADRPKAVLSAIMTQGEEIRIAAKQSMFTQRWSDEYAKLRQNGFGHNEAGEIALENLKTRMKADVENNSQFLKVMTDDDEAAMLTKINTNVRAAIREEERFTMISRFFDNIYYYFPNGKMDKSAPTIMRKWAKNKDPITYDFLKGVDDDIKQSLPNVELRTLVRPKTTPFSGGDAFVDSILIWTFETRASNRFSAEIETYMTLHPTTYVDLLKKPVDNLGRQSTPAMLTNATVEAIADIGIKSGSNESAKLFAQLKNSELRKAITTPANQHTAAQKTALTNFEAFLKPIVAEGEREATITAIRNVLNSFDELGTAALMLDQNVGGTLNQSLINYLMREQLTQNSQRGLINSTSAPGIASAYTNLKVALGELGATIPINIKYPLEDVIMANTVGLNATFKGNYKTLGIVKSSALTNSNIAITPWNIIEQNITDAIAGFGVTKSTQGIVSETAIDYYRPWISNLDEQAIGIIGGHQLEDIVKKLKIKAAGPDWHQVLERYRDQTKANRQNTNFKNMFGNATVDFLEWSKRVQMTGILGGAIGPNTRYHGVNVVGAPFLMVAELGVNKTAKVLTTEMPFVKKFYDYTRGKYQDTDVFFTGAQGKKYTYAEYAELAGQSNIATTFSASLFGETSISELLRALKITPGGEEAKLIIRIWRQMDPSSRTYLTMLAHESDMVYRHAVFRNGLREGLNAKTAAVQSREALLNYGAARNSVLERLFGKNVAFWSFRYMAYLGYYKALVAGKDDVARLLRVHEAYNRQSESYFTGNNREQARLFRQVVESTNTQQITIGGMQNPAYESISILFEGLAAMAVYSTNLFSEDPSLGGTYKLKEQDTRTSFGNYMKNNNLFLPIYQAGYRYFEDLFKKDSGREMYLPDVYVLALNEMSLQKRQEFMKFYELKTVGVEPKEYSPTHQAQAYKFSTTPAKRKWTEWMVWMNVMGFERFSQDTLKTMAIADVGGQDYERGYYRALQMYGHKNGYSVMSNWAGAAIMYQLGQVTPLKQDTPEAAFRMSERATQREIQEPIK